MFAKYKRRKPGVYWYVTRRHLAPAFTEIGYVGKSRHLPLRDLCHAGRCGHRAHLAKPWFDLVVRRRAIRLPWWLGWDWITLSLETLVILALRPRYNWQKNPWPGKVGPIGQKQQRADRDATWSQAYRLKVAAASAGLWLLQAAGTLTLLAGVIGVVWTNR